MPHLASRTGTPADAWAIDHRTHVLALAAARQAGVTQVLDPVSGRCDADATPSTGTVTLFDFYRDLLGGATAPERGDHAVF